MSNPAIQFRINPYHLARGLQVIRSLEPDYIPTSLSQMVKMLYIDYCTKMTMNLKEVPPALISEVKQMLLGAPNRKDPTLAELIENEKVTKRLYKKQNNLTEQLETTESIKSVVTDFSPPIDLKELNND